jgi:hypothetical protein
MVRHNDECPVSPSLQPLSWREAAICGVAALGKGIGHCLRMRLALAHWAGSEDAK